MTRPRKDLICINTTPYYHITSRCVRRAFLCGHDRDTNTSFEHRRQWVEDRLRLLASIFAIDICAYAVMSNHYHLVVKLSPTPREWSQSEVIERWEQLYSVTPLVKLAQQNSPLSTKEQETAHNTIEVYRQRLADLGWFMKSLNQYIAIEANKEDQCTGAFWESRYKSQALFTEEALLSAMAYVDLNPVRAKMAETPEQSDYTSIKERTRPSFKFNSAVEQAKQSNTIKQFTVPLKPLLYFQDTQDSSLDLEKALPFTLRSYIQLVDWTGKQLREDKRGAIDPSMPPILERLGTDSNRWLSTTTQFESIYHKHFARVISTVFSNTA